MLYNKIKDKEVSMLGFGAMRLPQTEDGVIDEVKTAEMVRTAIDSGINYFDTAFTYHAGQSERVMGRILKEYPRDSFYLATKFPGHQISDNHDPAPIFEKQLKKCQVDYFDFYLLHNLHERCLDTYMDPKWGIVDYFVEQKKLGRIKHLGFSIHGNLETIKTFLDYAGDKMEFCQIQLNYLDWTLQKGKEKVELLNEYNIPIIIMEPVRGGKLAKLSDGREAQLKMLRPDESTPAWAFRFLQDIPGISVILSGMSDMDQIRDNIKTFSERKPLSEAEHSLLQEIADDLKGSVPCTACKYCTEDCPQGLDIPFMLSIYNELSFAPQMATSMRLEGAGPERQPERCIKCGKCVKLCPQNIDIPDVLEKLVEVMKTMPNWAEICKERAAREAAENARGE